jgi:hypothetical protein
MTDEPDRGSSIIKQGEDMKKAFLFVAIALALPMASFAQDTAGAASAPIAVSSPAQVIAPVAVAPAVVQPSKVETTVSKVVSEIPSSLPAWLLAILAIGAELFMRLFPTKDPKSMFIVAGNLCGLLGSGFMKISMLLDAVVQNLTPKAATPAPTAVASTDSDKGKAA